MNVCDNQHEMNKNSHQEVLICDLIISISHKFVGYNTFYLPVSNGPERAVACHTDNLDDALVCIKLLFSEGDLNMWSASVSFQSCQHPWYGIRIRSNQEKTAVISLKSRGYEPFLPLYRARRRRSDRVVTAELPLFPGYIFCRFDHKQRLPIMTAPGVVSIICFGEDPAPVLDEEIEAVRAIVDSGLGAEPSPFLREGRRIRVIQGPLKSLEGTLVRRESSWRLVISVELLQRSVSVEIDPTHIEAL
jgi:transcriptional antiterminator NusG